MTAEVKCSCGNLTGKVSVKVTHITLPPTLVYSEVKGDFYIPKRENLIYCESCYKAAFTVGNWK